MKKLSLNLKIVMILSIFVVAAITIAFVGIQRVTQINESFDNLTKIIVKRVMYIKEINSMNNEIRNREKVFILEEKAEDRDKAGVLLDQYYESVTKQLKDFREIAAEQGKKEVDVMLTKYEDWRKADIELRKEVLAGNIKEATKIAFSAARSTLRAVDEQLEVNLARNQDIMDKESAATAELVASTRNLILLVSTVALLLGAALAFILLRSVNSAIDKVITNLEDSSDQVASAAQQIASSSEELSQATTEQASSLEETAASVEEMNSMVTKNTDNARQSSETSERSQDSAKKGRETVAQMIQSIHEISEANNNIMNQVNHSNTQISEITKVISEIGNKTKIINDIVFQTKLLSFNASVEAARAGEHGKGFAVVAEEVGNLAQMSGNAAKEISTMLEDSIRQVESIVNETKTGVERFINEGKQKVEAGTRIAKACGEVLTEIVESTSEVSQKAGEISSASREQANGISEITRAINQLDQVTQQNAATSEEAAGAAEELSAQAEALKSAVGVLIDTIRGENKQSPPRVTATKPKTTETSAAVGAGKVVHLKKKTTAQPAQANANKTSQEEMPSYDDKRFKEI